MKSETPPIPATLVLGREAATNRDRRLPDDAVAAAITVIVDWTAVAIGGQSAAPAAALRKALLPADGPCILPGTGLTASAETAALINGTAAHTLELDDIYSPGLYHPGAPAIAAALAAAQRVGASGYDLVRAVVIGYEIGGRVARTLGAAHYRYWHTTGTAGAVAAAAAAAEALGLDEEPFAHALALAATMGAGLQQTFRSDSMGKPLHSGHAAQSGVVAAFAARAGFTGTLSVLEGEVGLGVAMSDSPPWSDALAPFGPDFVVTRTTIKPYPCCGHTFAPIDAALDLRASGLRPDDVTRIDVETYTAALDVAGNAEPKTGFEARFSIPFVVAHAFGHGEVTSSTFDEESLQDPIVTALMRQVSMAPAREFDQVFPQRRGARVSVVDTKGRQHSVTVPDRRGDPRNPIAAEQLWTKFRSLVDPVLGKEQSGELDGYLRALPELDDVRQLPLTVRTEA